MDTKLEEEGLKSLEHIEAELTEIKERTPSPRHAFVNGVLQGMGAVVGSIIALVLIGWLLNALGIIPGFGDIASYLQNFVHRP